MTHNNISVTTSEHESLSNPTLSSTDNLDNLNGEEILHTLHARLLEWANTQKLACVHPNQLVTNSNLLINEETTLTSMIPVKVILPDKLRKECRQDVNLLVLPLNLTRDYASHILTGTREIIQNWWDRCVEIAGMLDSTFSTASSSIKWPDVSYQELEGCCSVYLVKFSNLLIGSLMEGRQSNGRSSLMTVNYATNLSLDKLVLGESSKRGDNNAAGNFGEGMKIEINHLIQQKAQVIYTNSNTRWHFEHRKQTQQSNLDILHVVSEKVEFDRDYLSVQCIDIPANIEPIDVQQYLFLHQPSLKFECPITPGKLLTGCDILASPQYYGRVYIHGIFHMLDLEGFPTFGIHFYGSKDSYTALNISRDRNNLNIKTIALCIVYIVTHRMDDNLNLLLLESIVNYPNSLLSNYCSSSFLKKYPNSNICDQFANNMCKSFLQLTGQQIIPVENELEEKEVISLGFSAKIFPKCLVEMLRHSPNCPTIDNALRARELLLIKLPDFDFSSNLEHLRLAKSIEIDLRQIFPPLAGAAFAWKYLNGFSRPVVKLSVGNSYIINVASLRPDQIHQDRVKEDPNFFCDGQQCVCVGHTVMEAMLNEITRSNPSSSKQTLENHLRWRITLHYMKKSGTHITNSPSNIYSSPVTIPQSPAPHLFNTPIKTNSITSYQQQFPSFNYSPPNTHTNHNGPTAPLNVPLSQLIIGLDACSKASIEASHTQPLMISSGPTRTAHDAQLEWEREQGNTNCRERNLKISATQLICRSLTRGEQRYALYIPAAAWGGIELLRTSNYSSLVQRNLSVLFYLFTVVFNLSASSFGIFFDTGTEVIAFNRINQLWFNVAVWRGEDISEVIYAWFLTICHEITHYWVKEHGVQFANYYSTIVLRMSHPLHQNIDRGTAIKETQEMKVFRQETR